MKRLLVLRHANAARPPEVDDRLRPLSARGIWGAETMAEHCASRLRTVELALCSSSIRTRQTLRLFERSLPPSCKIVLEDALYLGGHRAALGALRRVRDRFGAVLLVGHEPDLSELAERLCGEEGQRKAERRFAKGFKTASLAVLDVAIEHWRALRPGVARLRSFTRPKDLA